MVRRGGSSSPGGVARAVRRSASWSARSGRTGFGVGGVAFGTQPVAVGAGLGQLLASGGHADLDLLAYDLGAAFHGGGAGTRSAAAVPGV